MRIALVAGEPSGDYLGAGLIKALAKRYPQATFEGIGGQHMQAAGLQSFYPLEDLSVMGVVEVVRHLPKLLRIRRALRRRWLRQPPDVFIGVDAPDFNLGLAKALKQHHVPTVQYVSPTVWAWREGRVKGLRQSVDRVLCIYPFEHDFFCQHAIDSVFVGHPLADQIPLQADHQAAREQLGVQPDVALVALLPGSRGGEIERLLPVFVETARRLAEEQTVSFILPAATQPLYERIRGMLKALDAPPIQLTVGGAQTALAAADAGLIASGTATLEAMLLKCPSVMSYRVNALTAMLARRSVRIPYFAMPNLMAGERLMPEFVQEQATPENIFPALRALLNEPGRRSEIAERFSAMHQHLRCSASDQAADAVADLLAARTL